MSATYEPGRIALWDTRGRLVREIGRGAGEGPGEFSIPRDLEFTEDGRILVAQSNRILEYDTSGEFLGQRTFDRGVLSIEEVSPGRLALIVSRTGLVLVDDVTSITVPEATGAHDLVAKLAVAPRGIAVSQGPEYEVRTFDLRSGELVNEWKRQPPWFLNSSAEELQRGGFRSRIDQFTVDDEGRTWLGVWAPDSQDALERSREESGPIDPNASVAETWDYWIEAVAPSGQLLASTRFDDPDRAPTLSRGDVWTQKDELGELVVVELWLVGG